MTEILQSPAAAVLSGEHQAYLIGHAISDQLIDMLVGRGDLRSDGADIVFTWRDDSQQTEQRRPWPGEAGQYLWTAGRPLHLNILRESSPAGGPVLLCEGTKQSLAVASWAPPEYAVIGMPGCYGWMNSEGRDLSRFAGRRVLILLDADAAGNLDVYEAGERLAAELVMEEAASAEFIPSPAWGKDGIDDYLAKIAANRRGDRIAKLAAQGQPKPADRKPSRRKLPESIPDTGNRPLVVINKDRRDVVREILGHMRQLWNGTQLFTYGGVLTRLRGTATEPLDRDSFTRWMSEAVATYRYKAPSMMAPGSFEAAWPEPQTIGALLASGEEFAPLARVSRTPFARPDGSICSKQGYDGRSPDNPAGTSTMLITGNSGMDRLDIPDAPSREQAAEAARILAGEDGWLGDFPWRDESSRAAALALVLTPFIRGIIPLAPLAVISGLQPGVGKNLLADCIMLAVTGEIVPPLPWLPDDDDENRKQILSAFRGGASLIIFDEAHRIGGASLTRALTSITYADRILGVSKMASYPNQVTWISLGNQVSVDADMSRRHYKIELHPDMPDPENRPESAFAHPDLRGWTAGNRPELVTAALVMIRSWYAAGCPQYPRGSLMGSFEAWDKMMSGILGHAGVPGFLGRLAEQRAEGDTSGGYWAEHLAWLHRQFGTSSFTALDVKIRAMASGGAWDAPPRLDEPEIRGWTRSLGQAYGRNRDRWFGPLRIIKAGTGHGTLVQWQVQTRDEMPIHPIHPTHSPSPAENSTLPEQAGRDRMDQPSSTGADDLPEKIACRTDGLDGLDRSYSPGTYAHAPAHAHAHTRTREGLGDTIQSIQSIPGLVLACDIETDDAGRLFTSPRGLAAGDGGFIRLAGVAGPGGEAIVPVPDAIAMLNTAAVVTGHNFLGFDALALAWHHPHLADWDSLAVKTRDTELIARQAFPPRSREHGSEDKLGLDSVAGLLGVGGKTDSLARLKAKHGGYGAIPLDDPEYNAYLTGDLAATRAVHDQLGRHYDEDPYLPREHQLARIAGHISLNGFRVDVPLLRERLGAVNQDKADALMLLHEGWGLPLSRTVMRGRGKARHEETEDFAAPLTTGEGRSWLEGQFTRYQVPDPPRTAKSRDIAIGADELRPVAADPACPPDLRAMLALMAVVTGSRTIYQTTMDHLTAEGRIHPRISFRQASGRWSFTKPGLTVFGKHDGRHHERDILIPDEGHVLITCDLSQVDMRAMAGHSQDPNYMAMFAPGRDAHEEIAAQVGLTRQQSKAIGHGWNYGLGAKRMIESGMDPELVYRFTAGMEARFPRLIAWREEIRAIGKAGMILDNGFGRRMMADPSRAYTVAPALMGQGGARDIMCECLLRLPPELWQFLRGMIHDEVVLSVPAWAAEEVGRLLKGVMTWEWAPPGKPMSVPILCDLSEAGNSWGAVSAK